MIKTICKNCGKSFSIYPYRLKDNKALCCSRKCLAEITTKSFGGIPINLNNIKNKLELYYLIGLICTDGHIHVGGYKRTGRNKIYNKKYVRISLSIRDKELLYNIKNIIGGNVNEYKHRKSPTVVWESSQKDFVNFLIDTVGIQPNNKTFTLDVENWFSTLTITQKKYFILGAFDGDGGIVLSKQKNSIGWYTSIVSASENFNKMLINYFKSVKLPVRYKVLNNKYHYCLWTKKADSVKMLNHLYENEPKIFLKRKYDKYKLIKENYNDKT